MKKMMPEWKNIRSTTEEGLQKQNLTPPKKLYGHISPKI